MSKSVETRVRTAVIVTTYNRPDALAMVLAGYFDQAHRDFELLIADDGSGPDTRKLIVDMAMRAPMPLRHVWQEDTGFRPGAARNRAVAQAQGEYLLFLDGDCVPLPDFVARHKALADPRWFVAGNRILLSQGLTERALQAGWPLHTRTALQWGWLRPERGRP